MQPELRTRGEHSVRLVYPHRDQIVDQHARVAFAPVQGESRLTLEHERRVDPRHNPLAGSLLIATGPVDLSGQV